MFATQTSIITADVVAMTFLIPIFVGLYREKTSAFERDKFFRYSVWISFFGLFFDALSYILDGNPELSFIIGLMDYLAFVLVDSVIILYTLYIYAYIKETKKFASKPFVYLIAAICAADTVVITIGAINGMLYKVTKRAFV